MGGILINLFIIFNSTHFNSTIEYVKYMVAYKPVVSCIQCNFGSFSKNLIKNNFMENNGKYNLKKFVLENWKVIYAI